MTPTLSGRELADRLERYFRALGAAEVTSAYLFGAHAEGRAHRDSDVDVGVLVDSARLPVAAVLQELEPVERFLEIVARMESS